MRIIPEILLAEYLKSFPKKIEENFYNLVDAEISNDDFSFYTSVASVFLVK